MQPCARALFSYAAGPKTFRQQRVSALIPKLYKDKHDKQEEKKFFYNENIT